jgi:hypothetical protein
MPVNIDTSTSVEWVIQELGIEEERVVRVR